MKLKHSGQIFKKIFMEKYRENPEKQQYNLQFLSCIQYCTELNVEWVTKINEAYVVYLKKVIFTHE